MIPEALCDVIGASLALFGMTGEAITDSRSIRRSTPLPLPSTVTLQQSLVQGTTTRDLPDMYRLTSDMVEN